MSAPAKSAESPSRDPAFVHYALARAGYGAKPGDVDAVIRTGFPAWVDEQLAARADDPACAERLAAMKLAIRYAAGPGTPDPGTGATQVWPACDEQRPLSHLVKPIEALWPLFDRHNPMDYTERRRPRDEVIAATIFRAVHSKWQLREQLVDFWHKHFNVSAYVGDQIMVALPVYDRDVIRAHCFGNFRAFLEAVATSAAMQYYLSNRSSRAGAANENYARELFELHTLGRDAYLNDHYNRWRDVPGALAGAPQGYIDQDVYEAARAFTGWTIADGARVDGATVLPSTGQFTYVDAWHDGYQKRVLATDIDPFQPAMSDGRRVLDLVAAHPATARFICKKLAVRFVCETPPQALIDRAVDVWRKNLAAPDQIAQVVRTILLSPEFAQARGAKVKRPLAVVASFARATGMDFVPTEALANEIGNAGERLFGWPSPDGLPDRAEYFLTTDALRHRWTLLIGLADNAWKNGTINITGFDRATEPRAAARIWAQALIGAPNPQVEDAVAGALRNAGAAIADPANPDGMHRLARIAAYVGTAPAFQMC